MLKIRLSMAGAKKRPVYKIVVADSRSPRDGRFIEKLGFFNPLVPKNKSDRMKLEVDKIKHWMSRGAKLTTRVARILGEAKIISMPASGNNPLKAIPKKDRKKTEKDTKEDKTKETAPKAEDKKDTKEDKTKETAPKAEDKKDTKEDKTKETAPKAEDKKDTKEDKTKETAPKAEDKKDTKEDKTKETAPKAEDKKDKK